MSKTPIPWGMIFHTINGLIAATAAVILAVVGHLDVSSVAVLLAATGMTATGLTTSTNSQKQAATVTSPSGGTTTVVQGTPTPLAHGVI
jgi:hypothetical protein